VFSPELGWAPAIQGDSIQETIGTSGSAWQTLIVIGFLVSTDPPSLEVDDDDACVVIYTAVNLIPTLKHVSVVVLLLVKMYHATEDRWGWYIFTGHNTATGTSWV